MKKITNDYFVKFCDVIKRLMNDPTKFNDCLSDMINASEDTDPSKDTDHNSKLVYTNEKINMEVIKLDEYTKDFNIKRRCELPELKVDHQPKAVDAVCVNKKNEWFLIEFKNQKLKSALSATEKMFSSLWLIAFLYSKLTEQISTETDILKFARENITFILVVSSSENQDDSGAISTTWGEDGNIYTPSKLLKYKGYYFKELCVLNEVGLESFIAKFDN